MAPHPCCPLACRPVGLRCAVCWHMGPAGGEANKASALTQSCGLLRRSHVPTPQRHGRSGHPEPLLDYIPPRGRAWPEATQQARGRGTLFPLASREASSALGQSQERGRSPGGRSWTRILIHRAVTSHLEPRTESGETGNNTDNDGRKSAQQTNGKLPEGLQNPARCAEGPSQTVWATGTQTTTLKLGRLGWQKTCESRQVQEVILETDLAAGRGGGEAPGSSVIAISAQGW